MLVAQRHADPKNFLQVVKKILSRLFRVQCTCTSTTLTASRGWVPRLTSTPLQALLLLCITGSSACSTPRLEPTGGGEAA